MDQDNLMDKKEINSFIKCCQEHINIKENVENSFCTFTKDINDEEKGNQEEIIKLNNSKTKIVNNTITQPITQQEFHKWALENFKSQEFIKIFEIVPNPLKEREIIRELLKTKIDIIVPAQILK